MASPSLPANSLTSNEPGFVCYESSLPGKYAVVELHSCQNCSKLMTLPPGVKYCHRCGQHMLELDPIDALISQMLAEQRGLLQRKYLRLNLSERSQ